MPGFFALYHRLYRKFCRNTWQKTTASATGAIYNNTRDLGICRSRGNIFNTWHISTHEIPTAAPSSSEDHTTSKEVSGMLLIEQIYEPSDVTSDYVKCLACKHGRLCDKPVGEKVMAIAIRGDIPKSNAHRIILKCPKCGQKFLLSFPSE